MPTRVLAISYTLFLCGLAAGSLRGAQFGWSGCLLQFGGYPFGPGEARFMSSRRLLLWLRLLIGVGFAYQGTMHILGMRELAELFGMYTGWQSWPFVGGMRPLELTLWIAFFEFGMGVFLFGGLLTRILGGFGALVAGFQVLTLGLAGGPLNVFLLVAGLIVCIKGGGGGTMDSALGAMQRKSIERQAERDAIAAEARARKRAEREAQGAAAAAGPVTVTGTPRTEPAPRDG